MHIFACIIQVGAIGDAYMVISGAPDQVKSHADRIANVALGMCTATKEVISPFKYRDGFKGVQVIVCPLISGSYPHLSPYLFIF